MERPVAVAQPSFTTGELSPSLYGRIDLARYYTALKTCRNFIVRPYGGVMNRPGLRFVGEVKDSTRAARLIDFQYSTIQTYVLELGHLVMRFYRDGGLIVYPVGHAQAGQPVELVTPWPETDLFRIKVTQSADVMTFCHPSHKPRQLSRFDHHLWTLTEFTNEGGPFAEINIDTAKTLYASAVTGNITLTAATGIFTADMVGRLFYIEQSPDTSTNRWEVQKTIVVNDIRRAGVSYYQAVSAGTTGTVRPSILDGVENDGDPGVTWRYLHSGFGIVRITGYTSATVVSATVLSRLPDTTVTGSLNRTITGVVAGVEDPGPPPVVTTNARVTCPAHGFSNGDDVTISGVTGMTGINGAHQIIVIDVNIFDLSGVAGSGSYGGGGTAVKTLSGTNTHKWAIEAWGGDQAYPAATLYHQQRQVFGGSTAKPQTVWESRIGGYRDFGVSNPILDDDAITFDLSARRVNEIRHFVALRELIALTSEGAWLIRKEQGNPIPVADFQGRGGAAHVPPVVVGQRVLFVLDKGGAIRSLGYFFESDAYEGRDLTITASHLLFGKSVVDWAYQETPFSCVWMVTSDGQLLGLTYLPDQEVVGWHRHDTDGTVESICSVSEGGEDAVYVVVRRTIGGVAKRYIERMASRFFTDIRDGVFLDSALSYDGRTVGSGVIFSLGAVSGGWTYQDLIQFGEFAPTYGFSSADVGNIIVFQAADGDDIRLTITEYMSPGVVRGYPSRTVPVANRTDYINSYALAKDEFSGLGHLEGKTVSILADGGVMAPAVVSSGAVILATPAVVVHIGLPITADLETLDINAQGQSLQDRLKNVAAVSLIVEKTRGLLAGPNADYLLEVKPQMSGTYNLPVEEVTGPMDINIISDWSKGGRVFLRQEDPLPATILAAIPQVAVSNG